MKQVRLWALAVLAGLTLLGAPVWAVVETVGARVHLVPIVTGVTTNTTSTVGIEVPAGPKTFYGQVVCSSGACAQTQAIYGATNKDAANGVLICTITLTATTRDDDACPVVTANFPFFYVVTTATSGTAATGAVYVAY